MYNGNAELIPKAFGISPFLLDYYILSFGITLYCIIKKPRLIMTRLQISFFKKLYYFPAFFSLFSSFFSFGVLAGAFLASFLGSSFITCMFSVLILTIKDITCSRKASSISLSMEIKGNQICFLISDNGKGFEPEQIRKSANGLKNMKSRMSEIGGSFGIITSSEGTKVNYAMPLPI